MSIVDFFHGILRNILDTCNSFSFVIGIVIPTQCLISSILQHLNAAKCLHRNKENKEKGYIEIRKNKEKGYIEINYIFMWLFFVVSISKHWSVQTP